MFKIFGSCLLATILVLQIGCTPSASVTDAQGGVDGGGGGTLPAKPLDDYEFEKVIATAKRDLGLFVKQSMRRATRFSTQHSVIDKKLYGGPKTLWDVLQTTDLEILYDRPCRDANGQPRDGSIHASKPNTVCLSAFTIGPKTIQERAKVEIYALILHELSHFLGTTEPEAQEFQNDAAFYLSYNSDDEIDGEKFVEKSFYATEEFETELFSLSNNFDKLTDEDISEKLGSILTSYSKSRAASIGVTYSIYSSEEEDLVDYMYYRLMILDWYARSVTTGDNYGKEQLQKAFENANNVSVEDLQQRIYGSPLQKSIYDRERLVRPTTKAEAKIAVEELLDFSFKILRRLYHFRFGTRPNNLPVLHAPSNPWDQFIGKFKIVSSNCSEGTKPNAVGYEIKKPAYAPNELRLIQLYENGHGDSGGLTDAATVINAGAAVFVTGGDSWAERMDESGDLWAPHGGGHGWTQHRIRFDKDSDGHYSMTETYKWRQFMYNRKPNKDSDSRCVHQLSVQAE